MAISQEEWDSATPVSKVTQEEWDSATPISTEKADLWSKILSYGGAAAREPFAIASDVATGIANLPIKAAKGFYGLGTLATGGSLQDAAANIGDRNPIKSPLPSKLIGLLGDNVIKPSINKTAEVLNTDPSNIAAFVEAGGDVASLLGFGMGSGSPASVMANRTGNFFKNSADTVGNKLMDMTLKQPTGLDALKRVQNVRTALDGNFMPNAAGAGRLNTEIGSLETLLDQGLARGEAQGVTGSFQRAMDNVEGTRGQAFNTGTPIRNSELIDNELLGLSSNPNLGGIQGRPLEVPIRKMQEMKVQQGRDLQKKYGEEKPQFQTTIDKARVRGFKEELEAKLDTAFPELAATNQKLGSYYQLKKSLDTATNRIINNQGIGIGLPIKAGSGAAFGGSLGAIVGMPVEGAAIGTGLGTIMGIVEHPVIAPLLARQLYKVNKGRITHKQAMDMAQERMLGITGGTLSDTVD